MMFCDRRECVMYLAPQNIPSAVVLTLGNKVLYDGYIMVRKGGENKRSLAGKASMDTFHCSVCP